MTLSLYLHPFSSYCQKVLIAFYEREIAFEPVLVGTGDPAVKEALEAIWPLGKFPVLRDEAAGRTVAEASIIIEYLDGRADAAGPKMVPADADEALRARQ